MSDLVYVVDDEASMRFMLTEVLGAAGYATRAFESARAALSAIDEPDTRAPTVVLTDLAMPEVDGMALLAALRERDEELPVIVLTARGSERAAVEAIKAGAYDYLAKPADIDELSRSVARAVEAKKLRERARAHDVERAVGAPIVGDSPKFRALLRDAQRVARLSAPLLLRGETGTGKELVASLVHASSPRASGPLVRFNCAAIAQELAESELFGHARGAFTGAHRSHLGYFSRAHKGTLVLDEVGELPLGVQSKLLRALQQGEIQPVGAGRVESVDVRVIACTHRDLRAEASAGRFREDLYYRLAVFELVAPPLRERREDIALLIESFRQRFCREFALDDVRVAPAVIDALRARSWPGNVRELESAVARLLAFATGDVVDVDALERLAPSASAPKELAVDASADRSRPLRDRVQAFERGEIERALDSCAGNQSEAARALGLTRASLIDKCKRYGVALRR
ncbi:MAG: sigma-54-dependent Fis family transcriptional regulator [Myxococcales bacterium]|nr:sigma-54-dependent Fis family transcriptional regulator [Myxococcales bacterium]